MLYADPHQRTSLWSVAAFLATFAAAVMLAKHVDPYISFLYAEGGGLENAFFALMFLIFTLCWNIEMKLRALKGSLVPTCLALAGAALCLRFGQHGLVGWIIAELAYAAFRYQRRAVKTGTPQ